MPRIRPVPVAGVFAGLALVAAIAYFGSFLIAGAFYAVFFFALVVTAPRYALLLIFATAPFTYDVGGGPVNLAASELSLVAALPFFLLSAEPRQWRRLNNPFWLAVIAYFLVCVFSTAANGTLFSGLSSLLQMSVYCVLTVLVFSVGLRSVGQVVPALYGLMFSCVLLSLLMLATRSSSPLGLHKNLAGTELMYATIIGVELWLAQTTRKSRKNGLTLLLALVVAGLVASCSRGAWLGAFVGVMAILMIRSQYKLAARVFLLLIPIIFAGWFLVSDKTRETALTLGLESNSGSGGARLVSAQYAFRVFLQNPLYGEGVGLRKQYDATNVVLSTLAETGVMGAVTFLSIYAALYYMAWKASRRISRSDPMFSLLCIGVSLMTAKFIHGCLDHFWSRGVVPVWAGAGFVIYAYHEARRRSRSPKRLQKG